MTGEPLSQFILVQTKHFVKLFVQKRLANGLHQVLRPGEAAQHTPLTTRSGHRSPITIHWLFGSNTSTSFADFSISARSKRMGKYSTFCQSGIRSS